MTVETRNSDRFLSQTEQFSGDIVSSSEGCMHWVKKEELDKVNLVNDFKELLQVMLDNNLSEFQYIVEDDEWKIAQK